MYEQSNCFDRFKIWLDKYAKFHENMGAKLANSYYSEMFSRGASVATFKDTYACWLCLSFHLSLY